MKDTRYLCFDMTFVTDDGVVYKKDGLTSRADCRKTLAAERRFGYGFTYIVFGVLSVDASRPACKVRERVRLWNGHVYPSTENETQIQVWPAFPAGSRMSSDLV